MKLGLAMVPPRGRPCEINHKQRTARRTACQVRQYTGAWSDFASPFEGTAGIIRGIEPSSLFAVFGSLSAGRRPPAGAYGLDASRRCGGEWSEPLRFGAAVKAAGWEFGARLPPDGRWLLFASDRGALHGVAVFAFMHHAVIALAFTTLRRIQPGWELLQVGIHAVCVGWPIALAARRAAYG
ncbi:MAG: hypothetical protein F9K18_04810, partial [Thermoanaerobaculia bacterium]